MIRRPLLLFLTVLPLGAIGELFVRGKPLGWNFFFFISACLLLGWAALFVNELVPSRRITWLFPVIILFALLTASTARDAGSPKHFIFFIITLFFAGLVSVSYQGGRWGQYSEGDYFDRFYALAASMLTRPFIFVRQQIRERGELPPAPRPVWQNMLLSVLLIGMPISLIFFGLLALSDWAFQWNLAALLGLLTRDNGPILPHLPGIFIWAYILAGIFLHAGTQSRDENLRCDRGPAARPWLNFNYSAVAHFGIIVPLVDFIFIQFLCLMWGERFVTAIGIPYNAYTHYGFWGLTFAAALSFGGVLWLNSVTRFNSARDRWNGLALNFVIFILAMIVLLAAIPRLSPGITVGIHKVHDLVYPVGSIFWLVFLFAMFLYHEFLHRERDFSFAALAVTTIFAALLILV